MAVQVAVPSTRRVSHRVADMMYAADVSVDGHTTVDIPACVAAGAGVLLSGAVLAAAGNAVPVVAQTDAIMGRYGRNITVTSTVGGAGTIVGYDYLGQALRESVTLIAGAVVGKKMFKDVSHVIVPVAATISIGVGVILGVPYKVLHTALYGELANDVTAAAGALLAGVVTQSLTSGDPRGAYTPAAAPNGTTSYRFTCVVDRGNLHGSAHVTV
jgi:adenylate kinase